MIQKLKTLIVSLSILTSFLVPLAPATAVLAACPGGSTSTGLNQNNINCSLKCGSNINLDNATTDNTNCPTPTGEKSLTDILKTIINVLSVLVGAISVIMIIYGGFRYVTSAGSDSATGAARKTILYAIVGLIIVALAQVIVHFVLNNISA